MTGRGEGTQRMADALLRSVGGRTVLLRVAAPAFADDVGEELGLTTPQFQDHVLSPVALRRVRSKVHGNAGTEYELLVSASAVTRLVGSLAYDSANVLFGQAAGVLVDDALLEIASAASAEAFGTVYVYRLGLVGAVKTRV